ncbi:hypothetical protein [uncultured Desulfuromusa sp.]|uniref:hypothetical protein n=1 Tax=uncultured Desulfuromusa sp. TaxID=219183 RepID=UPI0037485F94
MSELFTRWQVELFNHGFQKNGEDFNENVVEVTLYLLQQNNNNSFTFVSAMVESKVKAFISVSYRHKVMLFYLAQLLL